MASLLRPSFASISVTFYHSCLNFSLTGWTHSPAVLRCSYD
jgi:hypothetical protein